MGTGTSEPGRRCASVLAVALAGIVIGGCGGSSHANGFAWLHPAAPPATWTVARTSSGAELAYPPNWIALHGDRGTATRALLGPGGRFLGYLNITPRQGSESLADWPSFRVEHNREEGDRAVKRLASATGLRFLTGRGSCVKDAYTTQTGSRFIEIACLVAGRRAESVIVGAASPRSWPTMSGTIERAIAAVRT